MKRAKKETIKEKIGRCKEERGGGSEERTEMKRSGL